jgi:hypothetical protein
VDFRMLGMIGTHRVVVAQGVLAHLSEQDVVVLLGTIGQKVTEHEEQDHRFKGDTGREILPLTPHIVHHDLALPDAFAQLLCALRLFCCLNVLINKDVSRICVNATRWDD